MKARHLSTAAMLAAGSLLLGVRPASAAVTPFFNDLAGFNAAGAFPPVVMNFDAIAPGANLTGVTFPWLGGFFTGSNVTFSTPGAPLLVEKAASTFSTGGFVPPAVPWLHKLFATSGANVLSPGGAALVPGPNPFWENDDLVLTFNPPVRAIGMDILYQSLDGQSYVEVYALSSTGAILYHHPMIPIPGLGAGAPGGSSFMGLVCTPGSTPIARLIINEFDDNNGNPDSNVGYDTIRMRR
jgi:hypothetical protein